MPIIRSSGVLYKWLLPVVLGALVYRLSVWCGAVGCVTGVRDAAASRKPDVSGQPISPIYKCQESKTFLNSWHLKMGPISCPKTSVWNYHSTLHNIPVECRYHLLHGKSLKSRIIVLCYTVQQSPSTLKAETFFFPCHNIF